MIRFDPNAPRWSYRDRGGRFASRSDVDASLAEQSLELARTARRAYAAAADIGADARAFFDIATPHPRPARAARTRAERNARAFGLTRPDWRK